MPRPAIPDQPASKSPKKRGLPQSSSVDTENDTEDLKTEQHALYKDITIARKRLKDHTSFDSEWVQIVLLSFIFQTLT